MRKIRIVFMGTPEFAVESLRSLLGQYEVCAVVTAPDKPAGRGLKLREPAVKAFAVSRGIPVLQPEKLRDPDFLNQLRSYNANLFIVVAFRKLPDEVWMMPEYGTFNLHASLLPQYRGAAPINHAVINGETISGVTTFFLNSGIDTGKIILRREVGIGPEDTAGDLHDKLMHTGAHLVVETVKAIESGSCTPIEQPGISGDLKPAPRIFREHCKIDWTRTASEVFNRIRGLSPYPGAYSILETDKGSLELKILKGILVTAPGINKPGEVLILTNNRMIVSCRDHAVELLKVQAPGKKVMHTGEFLKGIRSSGFRFQS